MYRKQVTRLFTLKFLGLFGTSQGQFGQDGDSNRNEIEKTKTLSAKDDTKTFENQLTNAIGASSKQVLSYMLEKGIPGLTVCVSKNGQVVWHSAFGFCDVENQLECRPEARMRIASISKAIFAATIVGPSMENDKLDLKSSIHDLLNDKEFPRKKYKDKDVDITIEQLLSHTAGIRHYDETPSDKCPLRPIGSEGSYKIYQSEDQYNRKGFYQRDTFRSVIDALEPFRNAPIENEPGTKFKYSSYGYVLLSAVMEKFINKTKEKEKSVQVEDYWMKILRRDWNLAETSLDYVEPITPNKARYYLRSGLHGNLINAPFTDNSVKWAGGGLVSTGRDLVKFGCALIDSYKGRPDGPLKKDTIEKLWTEVKSSYGFGFAMIKRSDKKESKDKIVPSHSGSALGASSMLVLYPESEVVVAILVNLGEVSLQSLAIKIADNFDDIRTTN